MVIRPVEDHWLTEQAGEAPALIEATGTFVVAGVSNWESSGQKLWVDYDRIFREVRRQQRKMAQREDVGVRNPRLRAAVDRIANGPEKEQAHLKLADYEHLQQLSVHLRDDVIPGIQMMIDNQNRNMDNIGTAALELDVALFQLMQVFIAEELERLQREILNQSGAGTDR